MSRARDTADQINRVNSSAADATAITVDSSENVGIGTSSSLTNLSVAGAESGVLSRVNVDVADSQNRTLTLSEQKITFAAPNTYGTNYNAFINYGLTSLQFGSGNTERIRIDSDGLKFNGDTAAANALDDYERGTFTPTVSGLTFTGAVGVYVRIGRVCHIAINLEGSNNSLTGDIYVGGLPFTSDNTSGYMPANSVPFMEVANVSLAGGYTNMYGRVNSSDSRLQILQSAGTAHASMAAGGGLNSGAVLRTSFTYQTT